MKIAINYDTLKSKYDVIKNQIEMLKAKEYEVSIFCPNMIDDIVDYTKKNKINLYIDLPNNMRELVKDSLSISTSTYVIESDGDFVNKIDDISNNRKPSEEKIWNRNYNDVDLNRPFPEMTKNDFIRSKNIDPNSTALEYFGKQITYGERERKIEEYSMKFETLGIKPGDSIALCLPNTPETVLLMAAMDENGIVCNNIFPLSSAEQIQYCINMMGSKYAFVLDSRYKDLDKIASKTSLNDAFLVNPFESNKLLKGAMGVKSRFEGLNPKESDFKEFKDFEKIVGTPFKKVPYQKNRLSSIQYTSGTKGAPKATMLTDDTFNARAHQYEPLDVGLSSKVRVLQVIPVCGKAFGEFTMHLGLANGTPNILLPTFKPDELLKTIVKYDGQSLSLPPSIWNQIIDDEKFKKCDMSKFGLISIGAEGATEKNIQMIGEAFRKQGFKNTPILGSGATELGVTFSTNTNTHNKMGTSGFPLIGNNLKIVNENNEELTYGQKGKIIYNAVSPSLGYINEDVELKQDDFGIDLGDYGFIDEEGDLTVLGRISDLVEINGKKIAPGEIESMVSKCDKVKYVYVVEPKNSTNKIRICYIGYDSEDSSNYDDEIMAFVPKDYRDLTEIFRISKVPMAPSLKTDRVKLATDISDLIINNGKSMTKTRKNDK